MLTMNLRSIDRLIDGTRTGIGNKEYTYTNLMPIHFGLRPWTDECQRKIYRCIVSMTSLWKYVRLIRGETTSNSRRGCADHEMYNERVRFDFRV